MVTITSAVTLIIALCREVALIRGVVLKVRLGRSTRVLISMGSALSSPGLV